MAMLQPWRLALCVLLACVLASAAPQDVSKHIRSESLSLEQIDEQLLVSVHSRRACFDVELWDSGLTPSRAAPEQTCPIIQDLNAAKLARHAAAGESMTTRLFAVLFPGSPAVNALLATLYISGPPNFLLALCPTDIDPSSLSVMVAFAVGGLLGDTLFHLLPEIFLGEDEPERVRLVLVEPNRNLILGLAILVGFMVFVAMDKGLRIATGGAGHDHSHGHSHEHAGESTKAISTATGADASSGEAKSRKKGKKTATGEVAIVEETKEINPSVKLGGYLNLMCVDPIRHI